MNYTTISYTFVIYNINTDPEDAIRHFWTKMQIVLLEEKTLLSGKLH